MVETELVELVREQNRIEAIESNDPSGWSVRSSAASRTDGVISAAERHCDADQHRDLQCSRQSLSEDRQFSCFLESASFVARRSADKYCDRNVLWASGKAMTFRSSD